MQQKTIQLVLEAASDEADSKINQMSEHHPDINAVAAKTLTLLV